MRILVPVDGSIPSRSVLQFVSGRAKQMPVMPVVQLLTVEPPVPSSGIGTMMELEAVRSAFAAEGERVLESLLPIAGGIPLYRAVVYGRPGEEIANASDTFCADLIAMGTHGRRASPVFLLVQHRTRCSHWSNARSYSLKERNIPNRQKTCISHWLSTAPNSAAPQRNLSFARATSLVPAQRLMS